MDKAKLSALKGCAEFLAELVRNDVLVEEQLDQAHELLQAAGVEV